MPVGRTQLWSGGMLRLVEVVAVVIMLEGWPHTVRVMMP